MKQDYFEIDRVIEDLAKSYALLVLLVGLKLTISGDLHKKIIGKR